MNERKQRGKDSYPFVYDENGLCEVRDPRAIEMLGAGGAQASGTVCKVNSGNCVSGCACKAS